MPAAAIDRVPLGIVLRSARDRLVAAGTDPGSAGQQSRLLLAHVLDREPSNLLLIDTVPTSAAERFAVLVDRRADGIPLQHLTGRASFRRITLEVGPGVFVPRPETEVMTGWAIEQLDRLRSCQPDRPATVVDLCTGSGAVAASLDEEAPGNRILAVELSESAAEYARRNFDGRPIELRVADIADALSELDGQVDLITANPPYIPLEAWESVSADVRDHDPELALFSGADGLDAIRVVAVVAARLLRPGGFFCCEHAEVQELSAPAVFVDHGGFDRVRDHRDLTDRPRFVTGRRI